MVTTKDIDVPLGAVVLAAHFAFRPRLAGPTTRRRSLPAASALVVRYQRWFITRSHTMTVATDRGASDPLAPHPSPPMNFARLTALHLSTAGRKSVRQTLLVLGTASGLVCLGGNASSAAPLTVPQAAVNVDWYCGPRCQYWHHRRAERERWREHNGYAYGHNYPYRGYYRGY